MNKRQRKKMFTRAFSKAYDESFKYNRAEHVNVFLFRDGNSVCIKSMVVGPYEFEEYMPDYAELTVEGVLVYSRKLR